MNCPDEVTDILLEIIRVAVLNIRGAACAGDAERCHLEADHVHNLPALLRDYHPELLAFYWNIERPGFMYASNGKGLQQFQSLWNRLAQTTELSRLIGTSNGESSNGISHMVSTVEVAA
jgi:hypothetical protein